MNDNLGDSLSGFDAAFRDFRARLESQDGLAEGIFQDTEEWTKLLAYKLLPHLAGEGCLVVAVAGGTNTGKSTVFNMMLQADVSPVRTTAAATSRPVLAGNALRTGQCLEGKLLPEFAPQPLERAEDAVEHTGPENVLFVAAADNLPDGLVLLDIPDVDSIDKQNWEVAESIQAAGDVLVAVLTGEKYKDERVVGFFRRAHAAGRLILPLMNKANPVRDFEIARSQLEDFCGDVGLESPPFFAIAHDFSLAEDFDRPIEALGMEGTLHEYLESLDVPTIKEAVYRDTVTHFASQAEDFLDGVAEAGQGLEEVEADFATRAAAAAAHYDPEPGEEVGQLLHNYIKSKRGLLSRNVGRAGRVMSWGLAPLGRALVNAVRGRTTLDRGEESSEAGHEDAHQEQTIEVLARNLARDYIQTARNLRDPAASLVRESTESLDIEAAVTHVAKQVRTAEQISHEFRDHVQYTLETWWADHQIRSTFLRELDTLLVLTPTAIALPLALYTGGVGVPEIIAAASPAAGEFFARIMEHQLADKWLDLIGPWRRDQQHTLEKALLEHLTQPCMERLDEALDPLRGEPVQEMRRHLASCRTA